MSSIHNLRNRISSSKSINEKKVDFLQFYGLLEMNIITIGTLFLKFCILSQDIDEFIISINENFIELFDN